MLVLIFAPAIFFFALFAVYVDFERSRQSEILFYFVRDHTDFLFLLFMKLEGFYFEIHNFRELSIRKVFNVIFEANIGTSG
jgi:hypothetical protein